MVPEAIRRRTIEQSFSFSTALLVLVLIVATMFVAHLRVAAELRQSMEASGRFMASSIGAMSTPSLLAYNYSALQAAAEGAADNDGVVYVVIQDKEGNLAGKAGRTRLEGFTSKRFNGHVPEPANRDVEVQDLNGNRMKVMEVAVPVRIEEAAEPWGTVRVGLSYDSVNSELTRLTGWLAALGLALAICAVICGKVVARRITAPLRRLVEATEQLSAGRMDHRIPVSGPRELAELAGSFNVMLERLQKNAAELIASQEALEVLNINLEEMVQKRTRALEESEAQYKTLVEHSPDSILIVQQGHIKFCNQAFLDNFKIPEDELFSSAFDLNRIFDNSSAVLARGRMEAWENGRSPRPVEILGRDASGEIRSLELRGSRIEYQGKPAAECLLVDATETKKLRERLVDTERLRALGELSSGVAHDFNNLLGAILGRVQLLRRKTSNEETDRYLAVIEKAAQDGRETVRRIQEFSRTRQDREFSAVDLSEIVQDALEITSTRWKDDAERRNITIDVIRDLPSVPPVLGKDSELREVFTNLILNATDAMPTGGKLVLSCEHEDGSVLVRISDTGVGMTEEIRRHLFDPFFTTKGESGTGLGLSMVYGIVNRHDGGIDVASALGKGTIFTLRFPVATEIDAYMARTGIEVVRLAEPGRILIIDDEPGIAEVLRDTLKAEGHQVDTAGSGTDGIKMAQLSEYDVVFTDLGMPDMSGWEVASRIRAKTPGLPVVLVTGWGATLDEAEIKENGIAAVVHKPFDIDDLVQITATVLLKNGKCGGLLDEDSSSFQPGMI